MTCQVKSIYDYWNIAINRDVNLNDSKIKSLSLIYANNAILFLNRGNDNNVFNNSDSSSETKQTNKKSNFRCKKCYIL